MKIRPLGDTLFNADGRTDRQTHRRTGMTKLLVDFAIFQKRLKI